MGKTITVLASYTDLQGTSESVTSIATAAVANVNDTGSVTITGTVTQGNTLTATVADPDGTGTITYQWKANTINIIGATSSTYTLTQAEVGKTITVLASYTDLQGTPESVTSAATAAVLNTNDLPTGTVTISNMTPMQGDTLTAANTLADVDGLEAITYQWKANGTNIGTGTNYILTQSEVGKTITVTASYTDSLGQAESKTSTATATVVNVNDAPTVSITLFSITTTKNKNKSGQLPTATDIDGDTITYSIDTQPSHGTITISGSGDYIYTPNTGYFGSEQFKYKITDTHGDSNSYNVTIIVQNRGESVSGSVIILGTPTIGQTLTASNNLSDTNGLGTITYQWVRDGINISGTSSTYKLIQIDIGTKLKVTASYTDGKGIYESIDSNIILISSYSSITTTFSDTSFKPGPLITNILGQLIYISTSDIGSSQYVLKDLLGNTISDIITLSTINKTITFSNVKITKSGYQTLQIYDSTNNKSIDFVSVICATNESPQTGRQPSQITNTNTNTNINNTTTTDCCNSTATIITNPSPLIQNNAGTLYYSNAANPATVGDTYVLKNVLGTVVSNSFVGSPPTQSIFVPSDPSRHNPTGMVFDSAGNLYVANLSSNNISKITPSGVISIFAAGGLISTPVALAFDNAGILYVSNSGGTDTICKITPGGVVSNFVLSGVPVLDAPTGLAFDSAGNLCVSNNGTNEILKIDPSGLTTVFATGIANPFGLAFDSAGNLYVASYLFTNTISKVSPLGVVTTFISSGDPLIGYYGLVFDSFGNLFISTNNTTVYKVPVNTNTPSIFVTTAISTRGLAFDLTGNLYVANSGPTNTITKVTIPISFSFSNVIIKTSGLNNLFIYDITTGKIVASDICVEISAVCFREGTKILCFIDKKEKYVPIEDIKEDTFVKIYNKTGKFEDSYKRAITIVKSSIINSKDHSMHKLYKLSKSKNPLLIADLYVTGSHALLYDNLSDDEFEKMELLINRYNNYDIKFSDEDQVDESYLNHIKNMIKYYNDYKFMIEDKYKLIAYFNPDFEEMRDNSVCNIYHIVLDNENKYENYGIYANGVLAESTCEVSLTRFPGFEKINEVNKINTGNKKEFDINAKLDKYLLKRSIAEGERLQKQKQDQDQIKFDKTLNEKIDKMEDNMVKQINTQVSKNYTYRRFYTKKNVTYRK